jgi:hypothetical protein
VSDEIMRANSYRCGEKERKYFSQCVSYTSLSFFLKPEVLIYEAIFMHLPTNTVVNITSVTTGHCD